MKEDFCPLTKHILNELKTLKELEKEAAEKQRKIDEFVSSGKGKYGRGFESADHLRRYLFNRLIEKL